MSKLHVFLISLFFTGALVMSAMRSQATKPTSMAPSSNPHYFQPQMHVGDQFTNIFSRTISVKSSAFPEVVRRVSGSAVYTVGSVSDSTVEFRLHYRYDGIAEDTTTVTYNLQTLNPIEKGKEAPATDASGLLYNPWQWGPAPSVLKVGASWKAHIAGAWELGPAADQEIRVIALDPDHDEITLQRKGSGLGPFANQKTELPVQLDGKQVTASVAPGHARWTGYTTVRQGVILSDALIVERDLTLQVRGGEPMAATERQFILLNAIPTLP